MTQTKLKARARRAVGRHLGAAYGATGSALFEAERFPGGFTREERERVRRALRAVIRAFEHFVRDV